MALRVAIRAVTLRRTKQSKIDGQPIVVLPPRTVLIKEVEFDESEHDFYHALEAGTFHPNSSTSPPPFGST